MTAFKNPPPVTNRNDSPAASAMPGRAYWFMLLDDAQPRAFIATATFTEAVAILRGIFGERLLHVHDRAPAVPAISYMFWSGPAPAWVEMT